MTGYLRRVPHYFLHFVLPHRKSNPEFVGTCPSPDCDWQEFECALTREIVELIDREADLLNRGRKEKSLEGVLALAAFPPQQA